MKKTRMNLLGTARVLALVFAFCWFGPAHGAEVRKLGAGSFLQGLPPGVRGPDASPRVSEAVKGHVPTSKWWSALAWSDKDFTEFPHPLAVKPHARGLRVMYPGSKVTANRAGIFGAMPGGSDDLVVSLAGVEKFAAPVVDGWSDWFVTALFADGARKLRVSYGHGSPFVFATCEGASPRVEFSAPPKIWSGGAEAAVLGVSVGTRHYALFAPTGANWKGQGTKSLEADSAKGYFSIALLPDAEPATLALFAKHAHAHVTDTRVEWSYDESSQAVTTTYSFVTKAQEGAEKGTLFALYPHQWRNVPATTLIGQSYGSVRGTMKLGAGTSFTTRLIFPGVLPWLPDAGAMPKEELAALLAPDLKREPRAGFGDTYWEGKQLGRIATQAALADATGLEGQGAQFRAQLRARLEGWFSAADAGGATKAKGVFAYEPKWGTLIGYPASYGSDDQLNDHHFHYGYFIKAAAEVARRDPEWAGDARWGGMVKLLVRDIANPRRDDPEYPFLRALDVYAGHSWASGHARFGDGNNNESSSEAMNAWAGLVLFGEATGDRALRDLGVWLFTTELSAIEDYWFGVHGDNFPAGYPASVVTMVWGGKGANATWFSGEPEMVHGINWLPITGASLYLGRFPDYCRKNYDALVAENLAEDAKAAAKRGTPAPTSGTNWSAWADIVWMYRALSDPADALAQYDAALDKEKAGGKFPLEAGNNRAALVHWLRTLARLGAVDRAVTADVPLYAVFTKDGKRTHVACNSTAKPRPIKFSDGVSFVVPPNAAAMK